MKPAPQREEGLFQAASQLTGSERILFLDRECGRDQALRQRLEALLAAHDTADSFMAVRPGETDLVVDGQAPAAADELAGVTIGRYKLLEKVGEGGCGAVYVAEQTEPIRRRVALKVIKLGVDTRQVVGGSKRSGRRWR